MIYNGSKEQLTEISLGENDSERSQIEEIVDWLCVMFD